MQLFLLPVLFALDLNLLDLPGVVGGCVEGEPADMADRTRRLVSKYLARPDGERTALSCAVFFLASRCS